MRNGHTDHPLLVVINPEGVLYCLPKPSNVRFGDFVLDGASCFIRRGAYELIEELQFNPKYRLAFWSSATKSDRLGTVLQKFYVNTGNVAAILGKDDLSRGRVKEIEGLAKKLEHPLERTVALDIRLDRYPSGFGNIIEVPEYTTEKEPLDILDDVSNRLSRSASKDLEISP